MLEGVETPEEKESIAQWLDQLNMSEPMEQQELNEWTQRSKEELQKMIKSPSSSQSWTKNATWIASAAAILLFVSVALLMWFDNRQPAEKEQPTTIYAEYSTRSGQRKLLTLSDGSQIWLGNASKIRYPKDFQKDKREIFLEGQAFFDVSHDSTRPFYVHVGELDVKVLGTSFDVENYTADGEQTITVASGKVLVQPLHNDQQWILEKGGQVVYSLADKKGVKREVDLAVILGRKNGELVFRNETLATIVVQLERWYDVEIDLVSPVLKDKRLSLSVKDEALERVLSMLSVAGDFRFEIQGKKVTLYKRKGE